jgi:predicted peptidase
LPKEVAEGRPWVWRARFPSYHTEADELLLAGGFHIAYMNTGGMLGSPKAKAKIPLLHIVSLNDQVVPPSENTFVLAERYKKLGGTIEIIEVKEGTEKSKGHHFTHPDPKRVAAFIQKHGKP